MYFSTETDRGESSAIRDGTPYVVDRSEGERQLIPGHHDRDQKPQKTGRGLRHFERKYGPG